MDTIKKIDFEQKLVPRHEMPLYGKHVLFTSPRNYAMLLGQLLIQRGARPVWMPMIEIWPMEDYKELDSIIGNMDDYDWIAFTSENGIEPFCSRCRVLGVSPSKLKRTRFAAFRGDAKLLEKNGFYADLIPEVMSPDGIVDEFKKMKINSGKVLVPCPQVSGVKEPYVVPEFIKNLEKTGLTPRRLEVYRTVALADSGRQEKQMVKNKDIDMFVFTSSAEIFSFLNQFGDRKDEINRGCVAYMGTFTAKTGREAGFNVDVIPEKFTMTGLLEAMEAYYVSCKRP